MGYHEKYRRIYRALVDYGFSPAKAVEILIDAKRGHGYALNFAKFAKCVARAGRAL